MDPIEFTRELVSIPSFSGEENQVVSLLRTRLTDLGFHVSLQSVGEKSSNLFAEFGHAKLVFSTHMDTVRPWIGFHEDQDTLYGRGSCDAKASIAAQTSAALELHSQGLNDIGLLFLAGEEAGSPGAKAANSLENDCRFLIMGEPTDNRMAVGSKGAIRLRLRFRGRSAHSAYPEMGDSAIRRLISAILDWERLPFPEHPILGKTTWNIGTITGGTQANVVPDFAEAEMMFRTVNGSDVLEMLHSTLGPQGNLDVLFQCDPVLLKSLPGYETTVVSFTTDIPLLEQWGEPLLLGPGSILDAHTDHENIAKKEILRAVDLYTRMAVDLLA